ncbi:MAG: ATP-binding protein [Desulfosudaceae bacterium]
MPYPHAGSASLSRISLFFVLGLFFILVPIFIFITLDSIHTHDQRVEEQLTTRGDSLIRSFEAGTRTGVTIMRWDARKVQWLLTEIARQPAVEYLMITNQKGKILAHSNPDFTHHTNRRMGDLPHRDSPTDVGHHRIQLHDGEKIFEVYKQFTPARPGQKPAAYRNVSNLPPADYFEKPPSDWCRRLFYSNGRTAPDKHYIFAGLDMGSAEAARKKYFRHIVVTGVTLFLIGATAIIALFALLAYRSARTSFARVKAFADEVVANMPAGLITVAPDRTVAWHNKKGGEILKNFSGNTDHLTMADFPPDFRTATEEAMSTQQSVSSEIQLSGPEGKSMVLDLSVSPIQEERGTIAGYLLLFKNLTSIRNLEKEVTRSKRLAAIGKLAEGVAHEIRNPLSSIKGLATYFKEKLGESATADTLISEVERLNQAVAQLLEFAHPIAVTLTPVSLQEMLDHSLRLVENDLRKKQIQYQTVLQTSRTVVETDRDRMTQILLNLYLNAIEAMDEGGSLTITIADAENNSDILIDVADTGRGIVAIDLDRIFDPYFTTRSDGTGLGLAIVYKLVETLRGDISVESVLGQGTIFHIRIPDGNGTRHE